MRRPIVISSVGRATRVSSFDSQNAATPLHQDGAAGAVGAVVSRADGLNSGLTGGRRTPRRPRAVSVLAGAIAVSATAAGTGGCAGSSAASRGASEAGSPTGIAAGSGDRHTRYAQPRISPTANAYAPVQTIDCSSSGQSHSKIAGYASRPTMLPKLLAP